MALQFGGITTTSPLCGNDAVGTIEAWINGGTATYVIRLYTAIVAGNPSGLIATSSALIDNQHYTFTGLIPRTYYMQVTDSIGDQRNGSTDINTGLIIDFFPEVNDCTSFGASDGIITVTIPSGGIGPYNYKIDAGSYQSSPVFTGLIAGIYSITTIDTGGGGCTRVLPATVGQPAATTISDIEIEVKADVLCNSQCNGYLYPLVSGTTVGTVTFSWTKNAVFLTTNRDVVNACAGTYIVTITDDNGSVISDPFIFEEPDPILVDGLVDTNVSCNQGHNGVIDISGFTGGTAPYTFVISGPNGYTASGGNSRILTGLYAGTYDILVTDANGCTKSDSFVVTEPTPISGTLITTDPTCNSNNGQILITSISGGTGAKTITWFDGTHSNPKTGLYAGTYSYIIKDTRNCQISGSINLTNSESFILDYNIQYPLENTCNGTISLSPRSLNPATPYTYLWSSTETTQEISDLCIGEYSVVVTDANGCTQEKTFNLTQGCTTFDISTLKIFLLNTQCCFTNLVKQQNNLVLQGREDLAICLNQKLQLLDMIIQRLYCISDISTSNFSCTEIQNLINTAKSICDCDCCNQQDRIQVQYDTETQEFIQI